MYAQEYTREEVVGGYQRIVDKELIEDITYSKNSLLDDYKRLNGFSAALEYNIRSWIGIVGEFGYGRTSPVLHYNIEFAAFPKSRTEYRRSQTSFLFGPRLSYRRGRFRVFGHALLGGNCVDRGFTHTITYADGSEDVNKSNQRYTGVATAFGGGLDVSLGKSISIRPVQLDLLTTYRSYDTHHRDYNQNQFRYFGGIAFKVGAVKR